MRERVTWEGESGRGFSRDVLEFGKFSSWTLSSGSLLTVPYQFVFSLPRTVGPDT